MKELNPIEIKKIEKQAFLKQRDKDSQIGKIQEKQENIDMIIDKKNEHYEKFKNLKINKTKKFKEEENSFIDKIIEEDEKIDNLIKNN